MNRERRGRLAVLLEQIEAAKDGVEEILAEEEDARDNFPENLQNSEAYERSEAACDSLTEAVSSLEDAVTSMEAATVSAPVIKCKKTPRKKCRFMAEEAKKR